MVLTTVSLIYIIFFFLIIFLHLFYEIILSKQQSIIIYGLFILSIAFIGYNTLPAIDADLYFYYSELDYMRSLGPQYLFKDGYYNHTPITNLLFYVSSLSKTNGILPFISTSVIFFNIFVISFKEKKFFKGSARTWSLYFLMLISDSLLIAMVTGVRQHLALSFLLVAFYVDFIKQKNYFARLIFYLIPILIHEQVFPVIILRVIQIMMGKNISKLKYFLILWPFLLTFLSYSQDDSLISTSINKLIIYSGDNYYSLFILVMKCIMFCIILYLLWYTRKSTQVRNNILLTNYYHFIQLYLYFTIGSIGITHLFFRSVSTLYYLALPLFIMYFDNKHFKKKTLVFYVCIAIIIVMSLYGLYGIKNSWRLIPFM